MGKVTELQPWTTLKCDDPPNMSPYQEIEDWVDTSNFRTAVLQAEVLCISNCKLVVGGGEALTIDEFNHAEYTAGDPDPSLTYLSKDNPYGSTDRLLKYIGWRIEAAASGGWEACFRLTLVLK